MRSAFLAIALLSLTALPGSAATAPGLARVTLIADSVADAIPGDGQALQILEQGANVQLQIAPCRHVDGVSCPYGGVEPPTVVDLANTLGSQLGPYVVVEVGYNDFADEYSQEIEHALAALQTAGVKHVWWLDLRADGGQYQQMNQTIASEAAAHADYMTVVDWNGYSRRHPDWFQSDGVHLLGGGAEGMATLIHQTLLDAGVAAKPVQIATTTLPVGHKGKAYDTKLSAAGGLAPERWSLLERAPAGLHLLGPGELTGTPRAVGTYRLRLRVSDADATSDTRSFALRITR